MRKTIRTLITTVALTLAAGCGEAWVGQPGYNPTLPEPEQEQEAYHEGVLPPSEEEGMIPMPEPEENMPEIVVPEVKEDVVEGEVLYCVRKEPGKSEADHLGLFVRVYMKDKEGVDEAGLRFKNDAGLKERFVEHYGCSGDAIYHLEKKQIGAKGVPHFYMRDCQGNVKKLRARRVSCELVDMLSDSF